MSRKTAALLLVVFAACSTVSRAPQPPPTEPRPVTETLHGVVITDPYRWLEDQTSSETRTWIDRQNAYADAMLGKLPRRPELAMRLGQLLGSSDETSLPKGRNGRYFFTRRRAGDDVASIYMRDRATGNETLLIDAAPMSPKHTTNIGVEAVSANGKRIAYYVREGGADEVEIRFFDVDARHDVDVPLPRARYSGLDITPDRVYFSRVTPEGPRVYRRALSGGAEEKLFGDGNGSDKIIRTSMSDDDRWLLATVLYGSAPKRTELYLKDLATDDLFRTVVKDLDARTYADFAGESLVLQTNWNAPNDRIMIVPLSAPERDTWRELIPENRNAPIQSVSVAAGRIFIRYLENVKPRLDAFLLDGTRADQIAFDTLGRVDDVVGTWHEPAAFFRFSSFAIGPTIFELEPETRTRRVFAEEKAPVNANDFVVEQAFATSKDGTRVPMFLFHKKGLARNGTNPAYLTGYGGFNQSQLPGFSARAISLAENGAVYALVNMRGGSEYGEPWHRAGMLEKKQNVFDDFYAAAQFLIDEKLTSPAHIAAGGTSNGGLLVTAAATQRPELFKAIYCGYPLVDMLRYDRFLVGRYWVSEYGSANDPEQFKWIYEYSPYQHVVGGTKYPAMLFVTGDADTRVAPLHARKMTALMQASSPNLVVLRYHTAGGHSGGEPLNVQVRNEAEIEAFLLSQTK
jgi:prolyl oligopeptidase